MENRNGLAVRADATLATGTAEREAAAALTKDFPEGATLGADKNYDAEAFVEDLKARKIEPHVAINGTVSKLGKVRKASVPPAVAASVGCEISMRRRPKNPKAATPEDAAAFKKPGEAVAEVQTKHPQTRVEVSATDELRICLVAKISTPA